MSALAVQRRSPLPVILAFVGGLAAGAGVVAAATWSDGPLAAESASPTPSVSASAVPPASAAPSAAPEELTLTQRARRGEAEAIKELESKPRGERSAEETLALAAGSRAQKVEEIEELERKIELLPKYGREKPGKGRIMDLAEDREVATETLAMLASLPGELGPDLLYEMWTGTRRRTETTELAEALLHSKDVREKASKSLSIALGIRETEECEKMAELLKEAIEQGDRRSLVPIVKLNKKRGCGEKKLDDCWKCLRDSDLVKDAVVATRKRSAP